MLEGRRRSAGQEDEGGSGSDQGDREGATTSSGTTGPTPIEYGRLRRGAASSPCRRAAEAVAAGGVEGQSTRAMIDRLVGEHGRRQGEEVWLDELMGALSVRDGGGGAEGRGGAGRGLVKQDACVGEATERREGGEGGGGGGGELLIEIQGRGKGTEVMKGGEGGEREGGGGEREARGCRGMESGCATTQRKGRTRRGGEEEEATRAAAGQEEGQKEGCDGETARRGGSQDPQEGVDAGEDDEGNVDDMGGGEVEETGGEEWLRTFLERPPLVSEMMEEGGRGGRDDWLRWLLENKGVSIEGDQVIRRKTLLEWLRLDFDDWWCTMPDRAQIIARRIRLRSRGLRRGAMFLLRPLLLPLLASLTKW